MEPALQTLASQHLLTPFESRRSHCELALEGVVPGSHADRYLRDALERSLLKEPHPGTSLLSEVQYSSSPVIVRFEGDETLEQRLHSAARGSLLLPLPFMWSVRVVNLAAAALDFHHRLGISRALELSPRGISTVQGKPRLNAAILEPRSTLVGLGEPQRVSLSGTLARCLAGANPGRRLALARPLLPAALIQFVDGALARACSDSSWQSERELLTHQQRRWQGPHFATLPERRSERELLLHQLGLLPALLRLEGPQAIDDFFSQRPDAPGTVLEFGRACALWRRERRLAAGSPLSGAGSPSLERAKTEEEIASRARVAQARFEFERRDPHAALLFAIDAAQAAPDAPDAWLTLAEIRSASCAGSQALCLAEAICASRGDAQVLELVLEQLGLCKERQLAAYFRVHGDHVLADWLEPRAAWQTTSQLRH